MLKYFLKFVLRNPQFPTGFRTLKIIFYVVSNNFSYTQLYFVFLLQKDPYFNHDGTDTFFCFFASESFLYLSRASFRLFFFFRKILLPFRCFFLKLFFAFLIISINHFYTFLLLISYYYLVYKLYTHFLLLSFIYSFIYITIFIYRKKYIKKIVL